MNKHLKRLLTVALAFLLVALPAMSVGALPSSTQTTTAEITKRLTTSGNMLDVPTYNFSFTIDPVSVDDDSTPAAKATMPPLTGSVSYSNSDTWKAPVSEGGSDPDAHADLYYVDKNIDLISGITWPHAGVYTYTVTENKSSPYTDVAYSSETYTMGVRVKNDGAGLSVDYVGFSKDDGSGTMIKVVPVFENRYSATSTLVINNNATGNYADRTKKFTYQLSLILVPNETGPYPSDLNVGGSTTNPTVGTSYTFELAHGDSLTIKDLPVGTKYTLKQVGATTYEPAVAVTINAAAAVNEAVSTGGASLTIGAAGDGAVTLTTPIATGKDTNLAAWNNTYPDPPTPTGILIDTLPYILLVLAGVGGLVAFIVVKRRRSH